MIYDFASASTDGTLIAPPSNASMGLDSMSNSGFMVDSPDSPDMSFVQNIIAEMFNRSATDVYLHQRTENHDVSDTHDEDPDPTYWPRRLMRAYFQPQPMEYMLKQWGLDLDNKMDIVFMRSDLFAEVGKRLILPGDLIEVTYRSASNQRPSFYKVLNSQESGNYRYQWMYVKASTSLVTGDITIRPPGNVAQPINDLPADL